MKIDALYLLRGGLVLRYLGLWAGRGPCLCFRLPSETDRSAYAGCSVAEGDVLRELTAEDVAFLEARLAELEARRLDTRETRAALAELRGSGASWPENT